MSGAVSFAFALGLLAPLAPAGLSWALAAFGLSTSATSKASAIASLHGSIRIGAWTGLGLASVLLLGALVYELDADVARALAIPSFLLSVALVAFGLGLAYRPGGQTRRASGVALIAFTISYGVVSIAGTAGVIHRLFERSAEQGATGVIGAAVLVFAGAATALAVLFAMGSLAARALGSARPVVGVAAVVAGGVISAIYWLPGNRGDVDEPGSAFGESLAGASRNLGEVIAGNLIVPALLFLAAAAWAFLRTARPGRASG